MGVFVFVTLFLFCTVIFFPSDPFIHPFHTQQAFHSPLILPPPTHAQTHKSMESSDSPHHNNSTLKVLSSITTTAIVAPTTETNNPPMSIMMDAMQREPENISLMNRYNTSYSYYNKYESANTNAVGGMMQTYHAVTLQKRKALDPLPLLNNVILDQQQQLQAARPWKLLKGSK